MEIINGKKIKEDILLKIKQGISTLSFQPIFCDVLIGTDPASVQYVNMKARTAEFLGIKFHNATFPANITTQELVHEIELLNKIPNMCGIIVQLPLPEHLDKQIVLDSIDPKLDVDCLGKINSDMFYAGKSVIGFPAAVSCMTILDSLHLSLKDKNIVVLGQGLLVGKPVTALLNFRGLKPFIIERNTEKQEEILKKADVIISGIGYGKYLTIDMVKNGVVLIDAGASESNAHIIGDVDQESVSKLDGYLSPVPGGVGPVTVATLFSNVLQVARDLELK